jgi:hypothetical protein
LLVFMGCRCVVWMKIFVLLTPFSVPSFFLILSFLPSQSASWSDMFSLFLLFSTCHRRHHHHHLYIVVLLHAFISLNSSPLTAHTSLILLILNAYVTFFSYTNAEKKIFFVAMKWTSQRKEPREWMREALRSTLNPTHDVMVT